MSTPGHSTARRRFSFPLAIGAAVLAALVGLASAQFSSPGDIRLVLTGGDHAGEYVLKGVEIFMCGFGLTGSESFEMQYFADDPTAMPSSVQASHHDEDDPAAGDAPDLVISFGDVMEDGAAYMIWEAEGAGTLETQVVEDGEAATFTLHGTTPEGIEIDLEVVCLDVYRFEGGGG